MITENKPTQDPINLSLKELIAADLPAPIQTEAKEDGFIALPSSSCQAYKYDEATETLYIRFTSGVYEYFDVPEEVVQMFVEAKSIGSFFYHNIRKIYNYALSKKYKVKGTKRTVNESTEVEPEITDEQETFYFTSSTKDILGVKGLEHPKAQGLAVEILAKFRKEFQSALDKADISQFFIMTLEFKDKEQMPNAELEEEELNDENPLD